MSRLNPRLFATLGGAALSLSLLAGTAWAACTNCGVIADVRLVERQGQASGVGAVAGGVGGALVGNQFGHGRGKAALTIAGAAGGAYAGHQVEKSMKKTRGWEVVVDMDDGKKRSFNFKSKPAYERGDKVKVRDGKLLLVAN